MTEQPIPPTSPSAPHPGTAALHPAATPSRTDVVVIGGGVMGSAAAWSLARRGAGVVLLEQFGPGHVQGASHGRSRIYRSTYAQAHHQALVAEARRLWHELEAETGTRLLHPGSGVATAAAHGQEQLVTVAGAMERAGVPFEWLSVAAAEDRWPGLRFPGPVLHEPHTAGRVDADAAVTALQSAAVAAGATVRHHRRVTAVEADGDGVVVRCAAGAAVRARTAVVAVGAWTADLLGGSVQLPPLRVTQEQPAHFPALDPGAAWPAFTYDPDPGEGWPSGVYGLASPGEGVKVGFHGTGPECHPDRRDRVADPRQLARLMEFVRRWLPGLDAERPAPVSCTYTSTPTGEFVLDRVGPVVLAAGFSGHGFKSATAVGRVLADLALDLPGADAGAFGLAQHAALL
ncbi:FAD-dependent oxidoreductase [Trujillonella endophytica]|uniref:Sarcosine oxidase n=1 Tax=Trujillonella endophytica TaxID=673521 RepID=A0A1H8RWU8_9ACTN|nr:FAD-dependent oxidoreductase [Trujillella endophytica]SEO70403.1 sarcosine oxidase [Trujillella endophytica]